MMRLLIGWWMAPLLFAAAASDSEATRRLIHCLETQQRQCLTIELKTAATRTSVEYLSAAAEAYLILGRNREAVSAIDAAAAQKPGDFDLLMQQGRTYQRCGNQVPAIQSFLLAAKAKQPSSEVFYNLGLSFFLLHEYERGGKHFDHAVQLDPKNGKAEFMLGVIDIMKESNESGAKVHLARALELEPDNPHYLLHYGVLLVRANETVQAVDVLERAVKADGANPLARFHLGRVRMLMNDLPGARKELEAAVRLRPQLARAHYQLAAVYRSLGETEKAKAAIQQFLKFKNLDADTEVVDGPPAYAFRESAAK